MYKIKKLHSRQIINSRGNPTIEVDIMLNNNGSALTEKRSQQLLDSGLTRLRFSLDAIDNETYAKVRVGSIHMDRVKKNIETFLNLKEKGGYKLPIVGVSFCKLKQKSYLCRGMI